MLPNLTLALKADLLAISPDRRGCLYGQLREHFEPFQTFAVKKFLEAHRATFFLRERGFTELCYLAKSDFAFRRIP